MIEAMKLALEALEQYHSYMEPLTTVFGGPRVPAEQSTTGKVEKAITALRQALEQQPTDEPRCAVIVEVFGHDWRLDYMSLPVGKHKLYTQQYLYTRPQPAAWVGLTDEEIQTVVNKVASGEYQYSDTFARAIEAKLKEKNT